MGTRLKKWAWFSSKLAALVSLAALISGCSGAPSPQSIAGKFTGSCQPGLVFGDLSWSPDGSQIAIALTTDSGDRIAVMNRNGSGLREITTGPANDRSPAWSPDPGGGVAGQRIAFISDRDGGSDIYLMAPDGSGITRLTDSGTVQRSLRWSPDGERIVFLDVPYGEPQIAVINIDPSAGAGGTGPIRLTTPRLYPGSAPGWSPDGSRIVFAMSDRPGDALYVMDSDPGVGASGGNVTQVTSKMRLDLPQPDWSPDGKSIVFTVHNSTGPTIYSVTVDTGQVTQLTTVNDMRPRWSPDGTQIAFISYRDGFSEIYVMDADGKNQTRLTRNPANQKCLKWPF